MPSTAKSKEISHLEGAPSSFSGFCPIPPVPKGRPRFRRTGKFVQTYTPPETEKYENEVRKWMRENYGFPRQPIDGFLYAEYEFVLPRPKSKSKKAHWSNTKPDVDNFIKSFQDGLDFKAKSHDVELGVIANDSRVAAVSATKRYADEGEHPGTLFTIRRIDDIVAFTSPNLSADALALLSPAIRKLSFEEIDTIKGMDDVELVYLVVKGESADFATEMVEKAKRRFPRLKKIMISKF